MERGIKSMAETAGAWHDRMQREKVSDETRRALADWLAASPRHQEQYESIDRIWKDLQAAAEDPRILGLRHETALRLTRHTTSMKRSVRWGVVAAVGFVCIATVIAAVRSSGDPFGAGGLLNAFFGGTAHYQTVTGERLAFALRDGSQVTLDTQSELEVNFTDTERTVRLKRGQAFFEVAKDRLKPFVVEAQGRRFVAVGTAFDVRVDGEQVKVTMVEGTVRAEHAHPVPLSTAPRDTRPGKSTSPGRDLADDAGRSGQASPAGMLISAGEQLVSDAQREDHVRPADAEDSTSWRRGELVFANTRLADAIAEINRYSNIKIQLEDADLADLRLSGLFATGRPTVFVEAVTAYFPVEVTRDDDRAVVLEKRR
jgi:transmembrane sensor